jgi:hypothetical protein
MEDVVNNLARELAEAIGTAVAQDSRVEECREKARAAGYEMQVSLEAEIGFGNRSNPQVLTKVTAPATHTEASQSHSISRLMTGVSSGRFVLLPRPRTKKWSSC